MSFNGATRSSSGMRLRWLLVLAGLVTALSLPAIALAAKSHRVNLTTVQTDLVTSGNNVSTSGIVSGGPIRSGAIVQHTVIVSSSGPTLVNRVTFTIFATDGSLSGTGTSTRTRNPDGTTTVAGTRTVTHGTGRYRGAKGKLTVTGTTDQKDLTTARWSGTLRY